MGTTGNSGLQSRVNGALQIQGWNLRVSHTQNTGYRDQEANNRLHLEVDHAWGNDNFKHYDWLAFQDGSWELPGAVDSLTAFTDSTATLAPGLAYDAYVRRRRALWGHHIHVPNLSNKQHRSSLDVWSLLRWSDKTNPFGTSAFYNGYKEESGTGGSLRIRQRFGKWSFENVDFQAEWTLMAVVDQGNFAQWSDAVLGSESPLEYDLDIRQSRAHWAPALSWAWDSGWRLETSAAFSQRSRLAQGTAADTAYNSPFNTTQLLPRVGASKSLGSAWTAFVQASTGFSDPTNFESLSTSITGALPAVLDAERAWTLESGFRHSQGEVVLYHQSVNRAIVQAVDSLDNPTFVNTTSPVTMQGIEWRMQQTWPRHRLQGSGAFQFHRWAEGDLPGSPSWMANVQHHWKAWDRKHTWTLQTWIRAVGATPLNTSGENFHPAYATANVDLGWTPPSAPLGISFGIRNATNTAYSGWHQLNGFGGKLYNPAPPRTLYVSAIWNLR